MQSIGIYIHVPFCEKKCPYCNFYSIEYSDCAARLYVDAVCREIEKWGKKTDQSVTTVYFGGGTPSLLSVQALASIIDLVRTSFAVTQNAEITMEVNPTKSAEVDLAGLFAAGVNRLSVGVQSGNDSELKKLGRQHTAKMAEYTVRSAQRAGFSNISADLMLAVPGQTIDSLVESINFCSNLGVQHVSAYLLKVEPGTPFYKNSGLIDIKPDEAQREFYLTACRELENLGFCQYEISNFSQKGYRSQHNLKYWNSEEYLGIGPSAHSFFNGKRFHYQNSLGNFWESPTVVEDGHGGDEEEYAMLRLRLNEGIDDSEFFSRFGKHIPNTFFKNAKLYEKHGLTKVRAFSISLTPTGFLVSNELIGRIIL